jgi:hypothetical protein
MANTNSTSTVLDHTSDAGFRAWVAEIITILATNLTLTQTADTGQINTTTVTRPATNTAAGFAIFRFNDTLQSTAPIFIKISFGTGSVATSPMFQVQIGSGSNGSGTLTGPVTVAQAACCESNDAPTSTITPFITRACYNATQGVLWLQWKLNADGNTNHTAGGFMICRSNDTSGAPTGDAVMLYTNNNTTSGQTTQAILMAMSNLTGIAYTTGGSPFVSPPNWGFMPFSANATLVGGNTQVGMVFQFTPVMGVCNWAALALVGEFAVGSTASLTLVGATAHTYISVGSWNGVTSLTGQSYTATGGAATSFTMALLWE